MNSTFLRSNRVALDADPAAKGARLWMLSEMSTVRAFGAAPALSRSPSRGCAVEAELSSWRDATAPTAGARGGVSVAAAL